MFLQVIGILELFVAALNHTVYPVIKGIKMLFERLKRLKFGIAHQMRAFERAFHPGVC